MHRQETDESCGPASVVTFLQTYFDIGAGEAEVFELATAHLSERDRAIALGLHIGTSLRGLRDALNAFGFRSAGVNIAYDDLLRYFDEVGLPVIAHFVLPEKHFVVIAGKVGTDSVLVADPSQGRYVLLRSEALLRFSGNVLLYEPPRPARIDAIERQLREAEQLERFQRRLVDASGRRGA